MAGGDRGLTLFLKGSKGPPLLVNFDDVFLFQTGLGNDTLTADKRAWMVWRTGPQAAALTEVRAKCV